jgi:acetyl esterase/lipase
MIEPTTTAVPARSATMSVSKPAPALATAARRRRLLGLVLVALVVVATGCNFHLRPIPGDAPLRYRDAVFANVTKTSDLTYGSALNQSGVTQDLKLDLYQPTGDTIDARPAIVWVHGGSFRSGSKASPEIVDQATTFARQGYVTVAINYRLSATGCTVIDAVCIQSIRDAKWDAQAAVRWLRANAETYGIDENRIAIGGSSAGAITALNVGYGADDPGTSGNPGESSAVLAAVSLSGAALLTAPNAGEAAALLFHGTADALVPYAWAQDTVTRAETAGLIVEMTTWEGGGHVPYSAHRAEILLQTTQFLYWTLGLSAAES